MFNPDNRFEEAFLKRFCEKIVFGKEDECWIWEGAIQSSGYGSFGIGEGKTALAHRIAYEIEYGVIPDGLCIRHRFDEKLCVNPKHLVVGTIADNNKDMRERGRQASGENNGMSKLTDKQVITMRSDYKFEGKSIKELAVEYEIHYNTARNVIHGNTWKDLPLTE